MHNTLMTKLGYRIFIIKCICTSVQELHHQMQFSVTHWLVVSSYPSAEMQFAYSTVPVDSDGSYLELYVSNVEDFGVCTC